MVTNPVEVDDVYHATAKLFGPLLRRLFPPSGRRRADAVAPLPPPLVAYEQQYGLEAVA
ncbi:hypothetical protein ACGF4C_23115 [Streptomyces sp. NPDC048197]|uniref:hypothetical protein n=1 Tax=Streptomyces sp. NPDC048197 TaxID=3365511 RepID=UPI00371FCBC0